MSIFILFFCETLDHILLLIFLFEYLTFSYWFVVFLHSASVNPLSYMLQLFLPNQFVFKISYGAFFSLGLFSSFFFVIAFAFSPLYCIRVSYDI